MTPTASSKTAIRSAIAFNAAGAVATSGALQVSEAKEGHIMGIDLMNGLTKMICAFGGKRVRVQFHGDRAFCSFSEALVVLPAVAPDARIPLRIAREIRGFGAHENAHILFTDEESKQRLMTEEEKKDPLFRGLWNAIEDYMIESHWMNIYPGSVKNFAATEARCSRQYLETASRNPEAPKDLRIVGPVALTWLRSIHFGLGVQESFQAFATMPEKLQEKTIGWFERIADVMTTEDCILAAREIYKDLLAEPYDPENPPQQPEPATGGQDGDRENQGSGQSQSDGEDADAGDGQTDPVDAGQPQLDGDDGKPNPATSRAGDDENGDGGEKPAIQAPMMDPIEVGAKLDDAYAEIAGTPGNDQAEPLPYTSFVVTSTTEEGPEANNLAEATGLLRYERAKGGGSARIGNAAQALRRMLVSRAKARWRGGRLDGALDGERLVDAAMGSEEVYKQKVEADKIDTALTILVDCSYSMKDVMPICQDLSITLHQALAGTEIKSEILGFTTTGEDQALPEEARKLQAAIAQQNASNPNAQVSSDVRGCAIYEFKPYAAKTRETMKPIGNMGLVTKRYTPTGEAILEAHRRQSARRERRHVMFVVTDGHPDNLEICQRAVTAVERAGVTVVGIGIKDDSVQLSFRNWTVIQDPKDLTGTVLSKVSQALLAGKAARGSRTAAKI